SGRTLLPSSPTPVLVRGAPRNWVRPGAASSRRRGPADAEDITMDLDFTALASRVAARAEVLGCVILSRDGLVLGSFPPNGEQDITPGLLRFTGLGEPRRGFVEFVEEMWAYVRHGTYAVFAVAEPGTRPGVLL